MLIIKLPNSCTCCVRPRDSYVVSSLDVLPGVAHRGCTFHFGQAMWRKCTSCWLTVGLHIWWTQQ